MPKYLSNPDLQGLYCDACLNKPQILWLPCKNCKDMLWGYSARGKFYYWGKRISYKILGLEYIRNIWNAVIEIILFTLSLISFAFAYIVASHFPAKYYFDFYFWIFTPRISIWIGIGLLIILYLISRLMRQRRPVEPIPFHKTEYGDDDLIKCESWEDVKKISKKRRIKIYASYSKDAMKAVRESFYIAQRFESDELGTKHLFAALLKNQEVESIFIRLGIFKDTLKNEIANLRKSKEADKVKPRKMFFARREDVIPFSRAMQNVVIAAYETAYFNREEEVGVGDLLIAAVREDTELQEMLYKLGVEAEKINNVVAWIRVHAIMRQMWKRRYKAAINMPRGETNKAMTAIATPFLNQFSIDLTKSAARSHLPLTIGREKEIEEIFRIMEGGGKSVLLVGENGVGKTAIVNAVAELMIEGDVPEILRDRRLVQISVPALLAGANANMAAERLMRIFNEVAASGNIDIIIESIEDIIGVSAGGEQSLDVSEVLAQELQQGYFLTIATTTPESYKKYVANTALAGAVSNVEVKEMTVDETIRVLEAKAGAIEYKNKVWFSYKALEEAAKLAGRHMSDQYLPSPAIEVLSEAAHLARKTKGKNAIVSDQDAAVIIANKTGIPLTAVTEDESRKLLRLEEEMQKRVIGQNEAVEHVANALRRARTELRSDKRPIANFLFLGPTGVGKTELAKTIAEVYFGSEDNMTRMDMSEFQDISAIDRLIGLPGRQGTGVLTEAIRKKPFSLLLLDELEKANKDVINIFLQVMDDGRLTDSVGKTVDFTNVILIATSNAGTQFVQDEIAKGVSRDAVFESLLKGELMKYFRPEFLNRFDAVVLFKSLQIKELEQIARLITGRLVKKLDEKGITLEFSEEAIKELAQSGYDPQFGARSLRRLIEGSVENKLAELILENKLKRNMKAVYGAGSNITITQA